jgi:predicted NAD-dependent protein-ADP-ribosyltransferase YbiA (DUF1768 family)
MQSIVCFSSRSKDGVALGKGTGELLSPMDNSTQPPPDFRKHLSNFWIAPFMFEGRIWPSIEHAFQAYKFIVNPIPERTADSIWSQFSSAPDAAIARRMGRLYHLNDAQIAVWDAASPCIMRRLSWAKYFQNPSERAILIATGSAVLMHTVARSPVKVRFVWLERIRAFGPDTTYEEGDAIMRNEF